MEVICPKFKDAGRWLSAMVFCAIPNSPFHFSAWFLDENLFTHGSGLRWRSKKRYYYQGNNTSGLPIGRLDVGFSRYWSDCSRLPRNVRSRKTK
jgi:hypothetical protein